MIASVWLPRRDTLQNKGIGSYYPAGKTKGKSRPLLFRARRLEREWEKYKLRAASSQQRFNLFESALNIVDSSMDLLCLVGTEAGMGPRLESQTASWGRLDIGQASLKHAKRAAMHNGRLRPKADIHHANSYTSAWGLPSSFQGPWWVSDFGASARKPKRRKPLILGFTNADLHHMRFNLLACLLPFPRFVVSKTQQFKPILSYPYSSRARQRRNVVRHRPA